MALELWVLDKGAHVRWVAGSELPDAVSRARLAICEMGILEWLYSARSARDYDTLAAGLRSTLTVLEAPSDIVARVLRLQADLAHHQGMWHRRAIGDLFIAETSLSHSAGIVHADGDFELIQEVRPKLALARL